MSMTEYSQATGQALESLPASADTPPTPVAAPADGDRFEMVDIDLIIESPTNPRTSFNEAKLQELAESVRASGVHEPVLVRPLPPEMLAETVAITGRGRRPAYELVFGARRLRASKLAGKSTIPAMVRLLTTAQVLEIQLIENLQREDLTELEEAEGYERLIRETGIKAEDIAAKVGKSKGTVYARLKLLDLAQDGREALRKGLAAGGIDASRALAIARIPDSKLQAKALAEATRPNYQGDVPSYRAFQAWLMQNVMLRLDAARFKITDASLVEAAGSCRECPKRTGANPDLFTDVGSADVCTDPACFHGKEEAHNARVLAEAKAEGKEVLLGKDAAKVWPNSYRDPEGYKLLDKPDSRLDGKKSLRKVLGSDAPEEVLIAHPVSGELVAAVPAEAVTKVLKERGLLTTAQVRAEASSARHQREMSAEEAKRNLQVKYEKLWRRRAIEAINVKMLEPAAGFGISSAVVRLLAERVLGHCTGEERSHLVKLLGTGKVADAVGLQAHIRECPEADIERVLFLVLMQYDAKHLTNYQSGPTPALHIKALATDFEVDLAPIQAEAKAEVEETARPKPAKGDGPAARTQESAGAATAAKKGGPKDEGKKAAPAKPKLSAEEAKAGIAAAMQGVEAAALAAAPEASASDGASSEGRAPKVSRAFAVGDIVRFTPDAMKASAKLRGFVDHVFVSTDWGNGYYHVEFMQGDGKLVNLSVHGEALELIAEEEPLTLRVGARVRVVDSPEDKSVTRWARMTGTVTGQMAKAWLVRMDIKGKHNQKNAAEPSVLPEDLEVLS